MSRRKDRELDEELRSHLDMAARDRIDRGERPRDAVDAARREFGSVALVAETTREMWGWGWLERFMRDVSYGARLLRRASAFSVVAILSLTLGIGVNTAIFQVIDALGLSALPVERPSELAEIAPVSMDAARGSFTLWRPAVSNPIWEAVRDRQEAFSGVFAWGQNTFNLATGGEVRPARAIWASGSMFDVLGVHAARGHLLGPEDDVRGCEPRGIISYSFWQREYGGDPAIVGRTLTLDAHVVEIIGVTEPRFFGLDVGRSFDVAIPICAEPALSPNSGSTSQIRTNAGRLDSGTDWWLKVMGRLKPGTTIEQANAHIDALSSGIFQDTVKPNYPPASVAGYLAMKLQALPAGIGVSSLRAQYETPLWMLLALAGVVLIVACANLANLMLARATARGREIGIRLSLGASRGRVMRQLITESLVLAVIGGLGGLLLARVLSQALTSFVDVGQNTLFLPLTLDWHVAAFTLGLAVLTCVLFGLAPAIRATAFGAGAALRMAGRGLTSNRSTTRLRGALIVTQVGLSFVLIVAALLFGRTLRNLTRVDPGFSADGVVFTQVDFRNVPVPAEGRSAYKNALVERLRAIPGIEQAASTYFMPVSGDGWNDDVIVDGPSGPIQDSAWMNRAGDGYFSTFRIPLIAGRDFGSQDVATSQNVAIVNRSFVQRFFPGRGAVGGHFRVEPTPSNPATMEYEIVGVVADAKYLSLRSVSEPVAYFPLAQDPRPSQFVRIASRSAGDISATTSAIVTALREENPSIVVRFQVLQTEIERTLVRERLVATLSVCFGFMGAVLAMVGLYGVMAYTITQRTTEIGLRVALGATRFDVLRMILRETAAVVAVGLTAGLVLALLLGRVTSSMLFGLGPHDPASIATAVGLLSAVALIAALLPARSATRIEPTVALKAE